MNPQTEFSPDNVYMFGYHPHGVISVGCFLNFAASVTGFPSLFPGLSIRAATLGFNLRIPFFRELLLRLGVITVSAKSIRHVLNSGPGSAVVIVPGGAAEALDARPGSHDLTLQKRNGFFRIALQHGVHLVPIYSFGENELYDQVPNRPGSRLRSIQEFMLRFFGYSVPYFFGAGSQPWPGSSAGVPLNPVPNRNPIITVVGDPIKCDRLEQPTQEQIDSLKEEYIARLKKIFDEFAERYGAKGELKIVK
jgi:2-acylglycerol O-acyltransferase 2